MVFAEVAGGIVVVEESVLFAVCTVAAGVARKAIEDVLLAGSA